MNHIKFKPWVGKNYCDGFDGLRTLVLGESHYQWERNKPIDNQRRLTIECIEGQLNGDCTKAFWTKIAKAMTGKKALDLDDKNKFWHSIAYYNYVQESAGFGPRCRPPGESWRRSEMPFKDTLDFLKPQFIVALGYRLWKKLPSSGYEGPGIENAKQTRTWVYPYAGGTALLYAIKHPSSAFSPQEWHNHIVAASRQARRLNTTTNPA
ncbi:MAG: hypothetical protein ACP5I8_14400 [Phycisphaerae bacterium]